VEWGNLVRVPIERTAETIRVSPATG
jgi:hypothetical protein